jgi:hypothetical protein
VDIVFTDRARRRAWPLLKAFACCPFNQPMAIEKSGERLPVSIEGITFGAGISFIADDPVSGPATRVGCAGYPHSNP